MAGAKKSETVVKEKVVGGPELLDRVLEQSASPEEPLTKNVESALETLQEVVEMLVNPATCGWPGLNAMEKEQLKRALAKLL